MNRRAVTMADAQTLAVLDGVCFGREAWTVDQILGSLELATTQGSVIEEGGQIVAFCLTQHVQDQTEILTLCVDPAYRRQGLGEALIKECLAKLETGTVFLDVAADNEAAKGLYERCGFMLFGRRPAYYNRGSIKVDALNYRYLVNDKS